MDNNLFCLPAPQSQYTDWNDADQAGICRDPGSTHLLGELIDCTLKNLEPNPAGQISVLKPDISTDSAVCEALGQNFVVWSPHRTVNDAKCKDKVWRVEKFLGMKPPVSPAPLVLPLTAEAPTVVVLNDGHLGFADNEANWPACLRGGTPPQWILLKISRLDLLENHQKSSALWLLLQEKHSERLVIQVTANSLRESQIQVSRGISWERTAQDLLWELRYRLFGQPLLAKHTSWRCAHVVVTMNAAGAFIYSPESGSKNQGRASLVFSPKNMESEWEEGFPGKVIGSASCYCAALALALVDAPDKPKLEQAVRAALHGVRLLHRSGYGPVGKPSTASHCRHFPFAEVSSAIINGWKGNAPAREEDVFVTGEISDNTSRVNTGAAGDPGWSFLKEDLFALARNVVLEGTKKALAHVPMASIGNLETADRREIEGFRGVGNLLREYISKADSKPVSFAVFGPPGSGKSFGVKEIARSLSHNAEIKTFNLSQFRSPEELIGAFHQVRDIGLAGKLPVVFWDEFDTSLQQAPLGWLRYFLEPMQDGTFLEGQMSHPIGRAIFVFAGGTRSTFQQFSEPDDAGKFKDAKGPDFVSRLRGFLNILGPNPINANPGLDAGFVIRRAILLHSMLSRGYPGLLLGNRLQMDEGVLMAFLQVSTFKHGARSMESLLAASALGKKSYFGRSCLPPLAQLNLHVDGLEFQALVEQMDGMENLAQALHQNYFNKLTARGYRYGKPSDEEKKISESLVPYDQLPEHLKTDNIAAARALPAKLAAVGYAILPAREGLAPTDFPPEVIQRLGELEHDRWLRNKLNGGWRYGKEKVGDPIKTHPAMLPWKQLTQEERAALYPEGPERVGLVELPESEKEKDFDQFVGLSAMLARFGCAVVKLGPKEPYIGTK